jgi:hypothetical protein
VLVYSPFSFSCVIHKEDLCPISGDINRLMMMMMVLLSDRIINVEIRELKYGARKIAKLKWQWLGTGVHSA